MADAFPSSFSSSSSSSPPQVCYLVLVVLVVLVVLIVLVCVGWLCWLVVGSYIFCRSSQKRPRLPWICWSGSIRKRNQGRNLKDGSVFFLKAGIVNLWEMFRSARKL